MSLLHRGRIARKTADPAAIFVHAGAGYHSVQNEAVHLQACNDAAKAAMAILRSGGTAVDAVECAIKVLEDREITNAGYGSNLSIEGIVEGDAVIVDHFGRSGGVGAVAHIKNPISAARLVLDTSTQQLTLRRVPPNLLVGQGAIDFAFKQGMPVLPNDALVSPAARERYKKWKHELRSADMKARQEETLGKAMDTASIDPPPDYEEQVRQEIHREHAKAFKAAVWNEGQAVSPPSSALDMRPTTALSFMSRASSSDSRATENTPMTPRSDIEDANGSQTAPLTAENLAHNARVRDMQHGLSPSQCPIPEPHDAAGDTDVQMRDSESNDGLSYTDDSVPHMTEDDSSRLAHFESAWHDGQPMSDKEETDSSSTLKLPSSSPSPQRETCSSFSNSMEAVDDVDPGVDASASSTSAEHFATSSSALTRDDCITDTVGAVAIDSDGNIACGASSGGIGMKYRGRIGPAALVGVGAAVVPSELDDQSKVCTAAVTSGTGEHMATTLAASVCAERLHFNLRKRRGSIFETCDDDQAIRGMIENDFMNHPSVKHSHSTGAIGVLAVKKSAQGAYLYFAHNTDSFALASMHSNEPKPTCTMSRSHGNGMIATGGRAIRFKKRR